MITTTRDNRLAVRVNDGSEPRTGETPDAYLLRTHEGEARALRLLTLDRPEPSADFDERFFDRLSGQKLIDRAQAIEGAEVAPADPRLEALLSLDAPQPGEAFDRTFRQRWRGAMSEDGELRMPSSDPLRAPGLPHHESPMFERLRQRPPVSRRTVALLLLATAASLAVTFYFAMRVEALEPPEADLPMVAHMDLLEHYDELEAFEALRDEDTFDVVASLDSLALEGDLDDLDDAAGPDAPRPEVKTQ
jgi:hypothetical protein